MWKRTGEAIVGSLRSRWELKAATKLESCGTWLLIREFLETGRTTYRRANWCQQPKLCPGCAHQRAKKHVAGYVPRVADAIAAAERQVLPHFVTLTVPNGPDLGERLQVLLGALAQAEKRRRNALRHKRAATEFRKVASAVWHLEIKRGRNSGEWHPHLHGLVLRYRDEMFDLDALHAEWSGFTGGRHRPDVRLTYFAELMLDRGWSGAEAVEEARGVLCHDLLEVLKYPLKFGDLAADDVVAIYRQTKGLHFVRPWGELRKAVVEEGCDDLSQDAGPWVDWRFAWEKELGEYRPESRTDGGRLAGEEDDPNGGAFPTGPDVDGW